MITVDKSCGVPSRVQDVWDLISDSGKDKAYRTAPRGVSVKEGPR